MGSPEHPEPHYQEEPRQSDTSVEPMRDEDEDFPPVSMRQGRDFLKCIFCDSFSEIISTSHTKCYTKACRNNDHYLEDEIHGFRNPFISGFRCSLLHMHSNWKSKLLCSAQNNFSLVAFCLIAQRNCMYLGIWIESITIDKSVPQWLRKFLIVQARERFCVGPEADLVLLLWPTICSQENRRLNMKLLMIGHDTKPGLNT